MATVTPTMRKLLNDPEAVVRESLAGLAAAHGDILRVDADAQIVVRADAPRAGKVALISGGGSGHEPLHGGFVGARHARRGLPGRGLHVSRPGPDAGRDEGGRRRRRRRPPRQELHGRRHELQARRRGRGGRGDRGRVRADRRRRGRPGLALHGRPPRRGRDRAGREARRRGRRARRRPRGRHRRGAPRERAHALVRRRPVVVHPARRGPADLRPAAGRDGGRDRDPRRAGPAPRGARHRRRTSPTSWSRPS